MADRGGNAEFGARVCGCQLFFLNTMAISRQAKEETLGELREKLQRSKGLIFTNYQGLTVKDVTELRNTLRKNDVELIVSKKTLMRKAMAEAGYATDIVDQLQGGIAMAFGYSDEVTPAKVLQAFAKDHPTVMLQGGVIGGQFLDAKQAVALSKLPGRDELRAKLVWVIGSPLSGLVNVTAGTLRSLLNVLNAINEKRPASVGA
jgi:large subunit ribosomal protein L10